MDALHAAGGVGPAVSDFSIRPATSEDAPAVARIYNPYIRDTVITFEEVEVSAEEIRRLPIHVVVGEIALPNDASVGPDRPRGA